jgi:hypothetical protein
MAVGRAAPTGPVLCPGLLKILQDRAPSEIGMQLEVEREVPKDRFHFVWLDSFISERLNRPWPL